MKAEKAPIQNANRVGCAGGEPPGPGELGGLFIKCNDLGLDPGQSQTGDPVRIDDRFPGYLP